MKPGETRSRIVIQHEVGFGASKRWETGVVYDDQPGAIEEAFSLAESLGHETRVARQIVTTEVLEPAPAT